MSLIFWMAMGTSHLVCQTQGTGVGGFCDHSPSGIYPFWWGDNKRPKKMRSTVLIIYRQLTSVPDTLSPCSVLFNLIGDVLSLLPNSPLHLKQNKTKNWGRGGEGSYCMHHSFFHASLSHFHCRHLQDIKGGESVSRQKSLKKITSDRKIPAYLPSVSYLNHHIDTVL